MHNSKAKKNHYQRRVDRRIRRDRAICEFIDQKYNVDQTRLDRVVEQAAERWGLAECTIEKIMKRTR